MHKAGTKGELSPLQYLTLSPNFRFEVQFIPMLE